MILIKNKDPTTLNLGNYLIYYFKEITESETKESNNYPLHPKVGKT